ncbi:hypothetical protein LguiA_013667 [Lonicera macranthoides]
MRMEQILLGEVSALRSTFVNIVRRLKKSILFVGRWDIVTMNDEPSEKIDKIQDVILQVERRMKSLIRLRSSTKTFVPLVIDAKINAIE